MKKLLLFIFFLCLLNFYSFFDFCSINISLYNNNFIQDTSSPYFPQSNGGVEAAVKVAKSLIDKNEDVLGASLAYRSSPLSNGFSPAELLMGRKHFFQFFQVSY